METIPQKLNNYLLLLIFVFVAVSCTSNTVFNQYKTVADSSWKLNRNVEFNFTVKDTISKRNLYINIRNNNDYKFSNLYLITQLTFPNKTKIIDTLQYKMADLTGRFLGVGFSEIKENKLFYKEEKVFPYSGEYSFKVRQAMRKNGNSEGIKELEGITDVGFSIEKIN